MINTEIHPNMKYIQPNDGFSTKALSLSWQIYKYLYETLPYNFGTLQVYPYKFLGEESIKIFFAPSVIELNRVKNQFPNAVSLVLHVATMELDTQVFGGMGGGKIQIKPTNKYHAFDSVKVPFRKPKREEKNVMQAIDRFTVRYLELLKENKDNYTDEFVRLYTSEAKKFMGIVG